MMILIGLLGGVVGVGATWVAEVLPPRLAPLDTQGVDQLPANALRWLTVSIIGLCAGGFAASYATHPEQWFPPSALIGFLALISLIDLRYRLVLNVITYPGALLAGIIALTSGTLGSALIGGAFALAIFGFTAWLQPGKLGGGDVKLATMLGLLFGFPAVMPVLLVGGGAGAALSAILLMSRHAGRESTMPYAPFLCAGAFAVVMIALFR